ncbi:hypothetical protein EON65_18730 [archaeon]|nr:MAG: hypothetical protein EON65_18730 [archaeon]
MDLRLVRAYNAPDIGECKYSQCRQILLIGPAVTIGNYVQNTARRLRGDLYKAGWCYPVKSTFEAHGLGLAVLNGKAPNVDLMRRIQKCLQDGKKVILSSDKFAAMHTEREIKRIQTFFKGYAVHIIAAFRDPLSMSYDWHTTIFIDSPKLVSFTEHLATSAGRYLFRTLYARLYKFAEVFGQSNMTVIDYHGIASRHKNPSYVLFCELLGILCHAKYTASDVTHRDHDLRPSSVYVIVRSIVLSLGCKFNYIQNKEVLTFYKLQKKYSKLDFSTLPMTDTNVEWFAHLARYVEQDVRQRFGAVMVSSNATASEAARQKFRAHEVDEGAFFQDAHWTRWMWQEVERLQDEGMVTKNCTVKLDIYA